MLHIGKAQLRDLNITKIYDLRSDTEIVKYNTPPPVIEGVEIHHVPVFKTEDYRHEVMARYESATSPLQALTGLLPGGTSYMLVQKLR